MHGVKTYQNQVPNVICARGFEEWAASLGHQSLISEATKFAEENGIELQSALSILSFSTFMAMGFHNFTKQAKMPPEKVQKKAIMKPSEDRNDRERYWRLRETTRFESVHRNVQVSHEMEPGVSQPNNS